MHTIYINANGQQKEADLTAEQIERLRKTKGFTVIEPPVRPRVHVGESVCISCE